MNNIINSGVIYFNWLRDNNVIGELVDENPMNIIDPNEFRLRTNRLLVGLRISGSGLNAHRWVFEQIKSIWKNAQYDAKKEFAVDYMQRYSMYADAYDLDIRRGISYENWRFHTGQEARKNRLKSLKTDLAKAEKNNDIIEKDRLTGKIKVLEESIAYHNAIGE